MGELVSVLWWRPGPTELSASSISDAAASTISLGLTPLAWAGPRAQMGAAPPRHLATGSRSSAAQKRAAAA
jgi:hypothetical protein